MKEEKKKTESRWESVKIIPCTNIHAYLCMIMLNIYNNAVKLLLSCFTDEETKVP